MGILFGVVRGMLMFLIYLALWGWFFRGIDFVCETFEGKKAA